MIFGRLRAAAVGWVEDGASQMGAALAYYTLFSLTPLLFLTIALVGYFIGEEEMRQHVLSEIGRFVDPETADTVGALLQTFGSTQNRVGTSIVGLVSLVFGATAMFTSLQASLQRIWRLPALETGVVIGLVRTYLLALIMMVGFCSFLLLLLLVNAVMPLLYRHGAGLLPGLPWLSPVLGFAVSLLMLLILFTFTFRFMSEGRISYPRLLYGAFITALLFAIGKLGIGFFLAYSSLATAYGAAGSVVVFLVWVYYSAQIVFYGAEVIRFGLPQSQEVASGGTPVP